MLKAHRLWHDAANRILDEESRLLRYGAAPGAPGSAPTPEDEGEKKKKKQAPAANLSEQQIDAIGEAVKTALKAGLSEAKNTESNATEVSIPPSAATPSAVASTITPTTTPPAAAADESAAPAATDETTAEDTQETIEEEAEDGVTLQEVQAVTDNMTETLGKLLHRLHSNVDTVKAYSSPEEYERWKALIDDLAGTLGDTQKDKDLLKIYSLLQENETFGMPPNGVIASARRTIKRQIDAARRANENTAHFENFDVLLAEADGIIQGRNAAINSQDVSSLDAWVKLSDTKKAEVYRGIRQALHVNDGLAHIKQRHETLLDLYRDDIELAETSEKDLFDKKRGIAQSKPTEATGTGGTIGVLQLWQALRNLPEKAGIAFYTPMQIWEALKQVGEALQGISKQKNALKISSLADQLGKFVSLIPGKKDAGERLRVAHEEENEKIKKGYKEALAASNWQPGFDAMFGAGGLIDTYIDDKNMTMAILDYAAGKGMIFNMKDLDWKNELLFGRWSFRDLVNPTWSDAQIGSHFGNVSFDNEQGEKKQEKIGYDNNITFAKVPQFIGELNGALDDKDLWYARGVIKRAMEKVDQGHMSSIIAVTIMRKVEQNPEFGRVIPTKWLDQIGGEGKELNMGLLKFEQAAILAWAKKDGPRDVRQVPRLGNFIADVRAYLIEKDSSLAGTDAATIKKLDQHTAELMSCEVVKVSGGKKVCTIYDKRFDMYQGELLKDPNWARSVPMDKSWDDFFVNPSEFQRGSQVIYDSILTPDPPNGTLKHEPRAKFFLSWLERTHQNLLKGIKDAKKPEEKAELEAATQNFRDQTRQKLDASIEKLLKSRTSTSMATRYMLEYNRSPVFVTLLQQGLLSMSIFREAIETKSAGAEFAKAVVDQCLNKGLVARAVHENDIDKITDPDERARLLAIEEEATVLKTSFGKQKATRRRQGTNEDNAAGTIEEPTNT